MIKPQQGADTDICACGNIFNCNLISKVGFDIIELFLILSSSLCVFDVKGCSISVSIFLLIKGIRKSHGSTGRKTVKMAEYSL